VSSDLRRLSVSQERRLSRFADYLPTGDLVIVFTVDTACDIPRLVTAVRALQVRHDSLASRFRREGNSWGVEVMTESDLTLRHLDADPSATAADVLALIKWQPLSLTEPMRATLCTAGHRRYLAISFDHLVGDGISLATVASDLVRIYAELPLPSASSYYEAADAKRDWLNSAEAERHFEYWRTAGAESTLYPSLWNAREPGQEGHATQDTARAVTVSVPRDSVAATYERFRRCGLTAYTGWLTSLTVAVRKVRGEEPMTGVSSFCHGRFFVDELRAVGNFSYLIPILFDHCEPTTEDASRMVRQALQVSLENAQVPRWLIKESSATGASSRPIFVFEIPATRIVGTKSPQGSPLVPLNSIYRSPYRFERTDAATVHASRRKVLNGVHLSAQQDDEGNYLLAIEFRPSHTAVDMVTEIAWQWRTEFLRCGS
jgi:hypothetical protein